MLDENGVECVPFLNILMTNSPKGNYSTIFSLVFMDLKYKALVFDKLICDKRIGYVYERRPKDALFS